MEIFSLKGKTALITGGGNGIGKSLSKLFAKQGAEVCILDYAKEQAEQTAREIKNEGGQAAAYFCDVARQSQVKQIVGQIAQEKPIDILVNNAGVAHIGNVENTSETDLDRVYDVNVKGVYNCMHAVIPYMKKNRKGVILNMASVASCVAVADRFAYAMSKGAVLTMTYSVAKDYVKENIRCNCIAPARVHTPLVDGYLKKNYPENQKEMFDKLAATQPIGRMGKPDEIAYLALYLCADESGFITGTNYPIDGGFIKLNA